MGVSASVGRGSVLHSGASVLVHLLILVSIIYLLVIYSHDPSSKKEKNSGYFLSLQ